MEVAVAANVSGIADGGALNHRSLIEKQMFNMSTEDKLKNVRPTFGNTVLPAGVLRVLVACEESQLGESVTLEAQPISFAVGG